MDITSSFKHQFLTRNLYSVNIAKHALSALLIESLGELGYTCRSYCAELEEQSATLLYACREGAPDEDELEEVLGFIERKTRLDIIVEKVDIDNAKLASEDEHLRSSKQYFRRLLASELTKLLGASSEYAMIVSWNGYMLVYEGFEGHVASLGVHAAKAHTHPHATCLPSHYDIRSYADALAEGACCTGIVSHECIFLMARRSPVTLEDYDMLMLASRRVAKAKNLEDLLRVLGEVKARLKSIDMEVYAL